MFSHLWLAPTQFTVTAVEDVIMAWPSHHLGRLAIGNVEHGAGAGGGQLGGGVTGSCHLT